MKNLQSAQINTVEIDGDTYLQISNSDSMRPFFMSIVSASDHWMFIASNGGLTAGRESPANALFPYYTVDKIIESAEITGSKTIIRIKDGDANQIWEPFSYRFRSVFTIDRNLYKSIYGNKIIFEEINHNLSLTFQYQWCSSDEYGFIRTSKLINTGSSEVHLSIVDGIQNIMPYGVDSGLQNRSSNLVDAYKRNELIKDSAIGIYALSAVIVDKAEPSEALKANVVWSVGFENAAYLMSSRQLEAFRYGDELVQEADIKGEKGSYFIFGDLSLHADETKQWMIVSDLDKNHAAILDLHNYILSRQSITTELLKSIEKNNRDLIELCGASDAIQRTNDSLRDYRHFSNVLFNIMRGGIFDNNYSIEKWDLKDYFIKADTSVNKEHSLLKGLPEILDLLTLTTQARNADKQVQRLGREYLPLKFSRRHGDPSRPWNHFAIKLKDPLTGDKILDYQGNWRDIFQNWEALAHSYPLFLEGMIFKFLNASTFDGYNPYRVIKDGFDWESIEADDPWSYIGYWGDHQIIYLLKFLELLKDHNPNTLDDYFNDSIFVYANVPYKIKTYADILKNSKDTIDFDHDLDRKLREEKTTIGSESAILKGSDGSIVSASFMEKILATTLAKISNFIPEGGIWMNTQRPEWNDANNALVGNGVSMVTLYYLRRFLHFFDGILYRSKHKEFEIAKEVLQFFSEVKSTLERHKDFLKEGFNNTSRKQVMDGLGQAGSTFRWHIYSEGFSNEKESLTIVDLQQFVRTCLHYLEHTIKTNKRSDNMYHAYNIMTLVNDKEVSISHLDEMLEGQVGILSAGSLNSTEAVALLDAMRDSSLYREDQNSYLLYPNKDLPKFLQKNNISSTAVENSPLLSQLVKDNNLKILEKDSNGGYHFNGNFRNANDLHAALDDLALHGYGTQVLEERTKIAEIFEDVFNHKAFTGRSGTFFAFEGLGSIYWHMVSKLKLSVLETCLQAIEANADKTHIQKLIDHYYEIDEGLGVHKSPEVYGAFPTDPYSHTPAHWGAQQPGMTGQVKEDILCRFGELGIRVQNGQLMFNPTLLRKSEFLTQDTQLNVVDISGNVLNINLSKGSICFTYCQIPVIYEISEERRIQILKTDGSLIEFEGNQLDVDTSKHVFERSGQIEKIIVRIKSDLLR